MMVATFLYLQVLDVLSTLLLLNFGVENEANFLARGFITRFGPVWGLIFIKVLIVPVVFAIYAYVKTINNKLMKRTMFFLNAAYMAVVAWNLFLAVNLYKYCFTAR
jgi:hypothetical protein